jgi:hypothetical protein
LLNDLSRGQSWKELEICILIDTTKTLTIMKQIIKTGLILVLLSSSWQVIADNNTPQGIARAQQPSLSSLHREKSDPAAATATYSQQQSDNRMPDDPDTRPQIAIVGEGREMVIITQEGATSHSALFVYAPRPPEPAPVAFFAVLLTILGISWRHRSKTGKKSKLLSI